MGRGRKKKVNIEEPIKEVKEEVKSPSTSTNFKYTGKIKIKYISKNKIVKSYRAHNQGQLSLFKFICDCLVGQYDDDNSPKYIQIFNSTTKEPEFSKNYCVTTAAIRHNSAVSLVVNNVEAKALIKFLIPGGSLKSSTNFRGNVLALYNKNNYDDVSNPMAYVVLEESESIGAIEADTNILIEWSLSISNS